MRKIFRIVPLMVLALIAIMAMSTVAHAAPVIPIGNTVQPHPYESNPTTHALLGDFISNPTANLPAAANTSVTNPTYARDRTLTTLTGVRTYFDPPNAYELKTFQTSTFTISGSPDIRIRYSYPGPADIVLVGTEPPVLAALTARGANDKYYDADADTTWDVGESAVRDVNNDGLYDAGDVVLVGPTPPIGGTLRVPVATDKYYDANTNTTWDVDEPAVRDGNASGTYDPDLYRIVYYVGTTGPTVLQDWTYAAFTAAIRVWTLSGTWTWANIASLRIRFETDLVGASDVKTLNAYEVWVRVYPAAGEGVTPPTSGTFPPTYAYDGDILLQAKIGGFSGTLTGWTTYQYNGYFALSGFENIPPEAFDIGWVDIKIRYIAPTPTDDEYKISYNVLGSEQVLQDWTATASSGLSGGPYPTPVTLAQCWGEQPEPYDGTWSWDDIAALEVKFETRINGAEDGTAGLTYEIFEVWLSIYPAPLPPSSVGVSVQPAAIQYFPMGETFFVDIYVTNVTKLWGYTVVLRYDTTVISAAEYYTYSPLNTYWPSQIDDTQGFVSISMSSYMGDPVGFTGYTPIARMYFTMDADGSTTLDLGVEGTDTKLTNVNAVAIAHTSYNGWVGSGGYPEFPLGLGIMMALAPIAPIVYIWRTRPKRKVSNK